MEAVTYIQNKMKDLVFKDRDEVLKKIEEYMDEFVNDLDAPEFEFKDETEKDSKGTLVMSVRGKNQSAQMILGTDGTLMFSIKGEDFSVDKS